MNTCHKEEATERAGKKHAVGQTKRILQRKVAQDRAPDFILLEAVRLMM
jgi:hypothetical protein